VLTLKNLHKSFGETVAVDDLSLEIRRGEVFGLLGPNGAGKTTAVNMAIGLLKPDRGSVTLEGAGWTLDFVNLRERRRDRISTYSGGMKRRLNLAVALVHEPELLLLDEPTVGVDAQSRNSIFEKIETMRQEGRTIVYTTHYMEEAQRLCDRVAIMDQGKLLALDTVKGLIAAHGGLSVVSAERAGGEEVRVETDDPVAELVRLQEGGKLLRFSVESPDLEGVFLNLTGRHLRDN
jgi:ABC-2 type transport system ATP-binding protein